MPVETKLTCPLPVLFLDLEPDSRNRLAESLINSGYQTLPTGNPKIASELAQESSLAALVISLPSISLPTLRAIVDARRVQPQLPIIFILPEQCSSNLPGGLADIVLVSPSDHAVDKALQALTGYCHKPTAMVS